MQITDEMLKPCPFCGGQAEEVFPDASTRHFIRCTNCGGRSALNLASHGGSAKDDWNRRAAHSSAEAALAAAPAVAVKPSDIVRWIEWAGGDFLPVPPEMQVTVLLRDGSTEGPARALEFAGENSCWKHCGAGGDIVAYASDLLFASPVAQATDVPEGWALVPIEPTEEMIDAGADAQSEARDRQIAENVSRNLTPFGAVAPIRYLPQTWRAMLAAAPAPKAEGEQ